MAFDGENVRGALRNWVSGVTVVTAYDQAQSPIGLTVSSFVSVSLEPPTLLVCLYKATDAAQAIRESGYFAVNILADDQAHLSTRFAGFDPAFPKESDRFQDLQLAAEATRAPMLKDALASLHCQLKATHDGATHDIFVGEVTALHQQPQPSQPLVYFNRGYHDLSPQESQE